MCNENCCFYWIESVWDCLRYAGLELWTVSLVIDLPCVIFTSLISWHPEFASEAFIPIPLFFSFHTSSLNLSCSGFGSLFPFNGHLIFVIDSIPFPQRVCRQTVACVSKFELFLIRKQFCRSIKEPWRSLLMSQFKTPTLVILEVSFICFVWWLRSSGDYRLFFLQI